MSKEFIFEALDLKGAYIIYPPVSYDARGYFIKDYHKELFLKNGVSLNIEEIFYSKSKSGVLRGIHFQEKVFQAKLVRCVSGKIYDVIVDLRVNSETFGQWKALILSEENNVQVYVPEEFGHGFFAIEESIVSYKCSSKFYNEFDCGIIWSDPDLNINWPLNQVDSEIIVSEKDSNLMTFREYIELNLRGVKK